MSMEVGMESVSMWRRPMEALSSDGVKELHRLQAENAKLRELVRDMGELLDVFTECNFACKHYHNGCIGDCYYVNARRELGIEADNG